MKLKAFINDDSKQKRKNSQLVFSLFLCIMLINKYYILHFLFKKRKYYIIKHERNIKKNLFIKKNDINYLTQS